ncbi:MAG: pyridoxine 5'-phosphate synthase [Paludibacteraceae bacterium]|nr:pyridoxine 5'-phosphate synthase [Paludibacteraceae bacterium]
MTKLSVNINKIATLRNSRGGDMPNVVKVALDCERFGAEGITVHPRPDERHIRYADVYDLKPVLTTEFNIEGNPIPEFIKLVKEIKPAQVTLVPDAHDALTSNAGWDTRKNLIFLREVISEFQKEGIRVSVFVDTDLANIEYAAKTGTDRIELYTEPYAAAYKNDKFAAVQPFVEAAREAHRLGLGINAGHDLNLENLAFLHQNIPWLDEVSIGHALIADALYLGLEETIRQYKARLTEI